MDPNPRRIDEEKQVPCVETTRGRTFRLPVFRGGIIVLVLLSAALAWGWRFHSREDRGTGPAETLPQDPRLAYTGPFRNIHPDVHYVGDEQCAGCHTKETET